MKWNGSAWAAVGGTFTANRISVTTYPTKIPYAVKSNGTVYKLVGGAWVQVTTGCKDIAAGGGTFFCNDSSNIIKRWNPTLLTLEPVVDALGAGMAGTNVSVNFNNEVIATDVNGAAWSWL